MPIVAVIGPSGAGKSTLIDKYTSEHPDAILHKTITTRPQRGPSDTSHQFVGQAEFDALEQDKKLIYSAPAYGFSYGMPILPADTDKIIFVLLRAQFIPTFKRLCPAATVIQIETDVATLARRLSRRGDADRVDKVALQKEIEIGRELTEAIIITSKPIRESYKEFSAILNT